MRGLECKDRCLLYIIVCHAFHIRHSGALRTERVLREKGRSSQPAPRGPLPSLIPSENESTTRAGRPLPPPPRDEHGPGRRKTKSSPLY